MRVQRVLRRRSLACFDEPQNISSLVSRASGASLTPSQHARPLSLGLGLAGLETGDRRDRRLLKIPTIGLLLLLLATLPSPLEAAEDEVAVAKDGTVTLVRQVPVPASALLAVLTDPALASKLAPDVISKELVTPGVCPVYKVATKGVFRPLVYTFRSCTSPTGVTEELIASDDFEAFSSRWLLTPVPGGTEVRYDLLVQTRLNVPHKLVRLSLRRSMRATMNRLMEQVDERLNGKD